MSSSSKDGDDDDDAVTGPLYNVWNELQDANVPVHICKKLQQGLSADFGICMLNINLSANIGMTVRTACVLGCRNFIICGRKQYDKRFTVGAHHYIPVTYWESPLHVKIHCIPQTNHQEYEEILEYDATKFAMHCAQDEYTPVFIEQGGEDIREICWKSIHKPLLIMGNESNGIPQFFIKDVKHKVPGTKVVSIPQWSVLRSMNVSVAATIALWEVRKHLAK
jgi:tRNA G18 (ribose-2'-O)-methylase SpoU